MRSLAAGFCLALACAAASGARPPQPPPSAAPRPPNFVVILGEGQGWSSTSVRMDERIAASRAPAGLTPNLERLAREGMRFSDFYAAGPRCTPARASLLTGISPAKLRMTYVDEGGRQKRRGGREDGPAGAGPAAAKLVPPAPVTELPRSARTIASLLKAAGYATAHFGKWHVGRAGPALHGFDENDGANTNAGPGGNRTPNPEEADAITARGIAFIEKQARAGRPFHLQLSHYGGGSPAESRPETRRRVAELLPARRGKEMERAAVLADMDRTIGILLAKLAELGLERSTYVFYTADHGSPGRANAPLAGGKGSVREGGVRVPLIVRGPGVPADRCSRVRAIGWDLLPTLLDLAGAGRALPPGVEGGSLAPVLRGREQAVRRPRQEIVIHFPHYDLANGGPASAIYLGDHKLIRSYETETSALYDLSADLSEQGDLSARLPARAAELEARLAAYLKAVDAQMPVPARGPGRSAGR